jgi:TonB family protein
MALASDEQGDSLDTLQFSFASDIVELVVLTGDEAFLQTMREAVGGPKRLWHVISAEKVSDLLVAGEVGIVVLDVAAMHEAPHVFVTQIKRQFPDLVVVVAGSRDAEIALAGLISAGVVYRFIHKPLSPGRARLFAEAAVRKYGEQRLRAAAPERFAPERRPVRLGLAAVLALILIAAGVWALRAGSRRQSVAASPPQAGSSRGALLAQAAAALSANRLTSPAGSNALELYLRASAQSPADPVARAGLADVRDRLLARAENALLEERTDEAAAAIETARRAGVESGRIAFLSAQLVKLKDQIRATQTARARAAAAKVSAAPPPDERVASLLNLATQRLENGQLIDPDHDSARYYVDAALSIDPNDAAAQEARHELAARLLSEARASIDRRDFARAVQWLQDADGVAAPAAIDSLQGLLTGARQEAQADAFAQLFKNAGERLQQDRLIEPANDSAKYYLITLRGVDPDHPGLAGALQDLGSRLIAKARLALTLQQYAAARSWFDEATSIGFAGPEANLVRQQLDGAAAENAPPDDLMPASRLNLVKSVPPVYPVRARAAGIEGWVDLDFTVAEDGIVRSIEVHAASTPGVFEDAAIKAVSQWRYQPVLRDNQPVAVRTRLRVRFTAAS